MNKLLIGMLLFSCNADAVRYCEEQNTPDNYYNCLLNF